MTSFLLGYLYKDHGSMCDHNLKSWAVRTPRNELGVEGTQTHSIVVTQMHWILHQFVLPLCRLVPTPSGGGIFC